MMARRPAWTSGPVERETAETQTYRFFMVCGDLLSPPESLLRSLTSVLFHHQSKSIFHLLCFHSLPLWTKQKQLSVARLEIFGASSSTCSILYGDLEVNENKKLHVKQLRNQLKQHSRALQKDFMLSWLRPPRRPAMSSGCLDIKSWRLTFSQYKICILSFENKWTFNHVKSAMFNHFLFHLL